MIYGGPSAEDSSVNGNAPAGADNHRVSHLNLLHWNVLNRISPADRCGFGTQIHQSPDGIAGFSLGPGFQVFSQGDQSENHGGGLKIEVLAVLCDDIPFPMPHGPGHTEQSGHAVNQGGQASHGNQRIHVGAAVPQGLQSPGIIHPIQKNHRQGQEKLKQRRNQGVLGAVIPAWNRQADHMPHGEIHQNRQAEKRTDDAGLHFGQRVIRRF